MKMILHTDGGARGNPGPAGIGVVLQWTDADGVKKEWTEGDYIGEATNNVAEYSALIRGLEEAKKIGAHEVECYLDSELLVKQMKREYRVKNKDLQKLFVQAWNAAHAFGHSTFTHIPREKNRRADVLVNAAIDKRSRV